MKQATPETIQQAVVAFDELALLGWTPDLPGNTAREEFESGYEVAMFKNLTDEKRGLNAYVVAFISPFAVINVRAENEDTEDTLTFTEAAVSIMEVTDAPTPLRYLADAGMTDTLQIKAQNAGQTFRVLTDDVLLSTF